VGRTALEGLKGVTEVTRGWRGFMEINTVYYDSSEITIKEMENILKRARTYRETIIID
jgi:hypothetical protein